MMKKQNGITLIALVITIIVLLILAGVSIAMLTGDNGILTKAKTAKSESAQGEVLEAVKLGIAEIQADKLDTVSTTKNTDGVMSVKSIADAAIRNNTSIEKTKDKDTAYTTDEITGETEIPLTLNNVDYTVTYTPAEKDATTGAITTPATLEIEVVTK